MPKTYPQLLVNFMADWSILITDGLDEDGQSILRAQAGVDDRSSISPAELLQAIGAYDALIVRSRPKVTADVLTAAPRLKVVGRAGVGVDNIDNKQPTKDDMFLTKGYR